MRSEGYSTWSVCLCVCLSVTTFSATARNNAPNKIYQRFRQDMSKVLKMVFSLKMLRSGVTVIFAYAAKSAIFFTLVSRGAEIMPGINWEFWGAARI